MFIKTREAQLREKSYSAFKHLFMLEEVTGSANVVDIIGGVTAAATVAGALPASDVGSRLIDIADNTTPSTGTITSPEGKSFAVFGAFNPILGGLTLGSTSNPAIRMQTIFQMGVNDGSAAYQGGAMTNDGAIHAVLMVVDRASNELKTYQDSTTVLNTVDISSMVDVTISNAMSFNSAGSGLNACAFGYAVFDGKVPSKIVDVAMGMALKWKKGQLQIDERAGDWT